MVSFWPFRSGDDTSAANFEKTLSTLTAKLQKANERDAFLRSRSRRFKALWTLYTSFAYILYALILALVMGYQAWGIPEYAAVAGGPIVIFGVRAAISAFYDYSVGTNKAYTKTVTAQRKQAIDKFKSATKYDSTQQLLEKYGAEKPKADENQSRVEGEEQPKKGRGKQQREEREQGRQRQPPPPRTNLPPPPTANIQRPDMPPPGPSPLSQGPPISSQQHQQLSSPNSPISMQDPSFSPGSTVAVAPAQYAAAPSQPQWYDRLLDVLLGDDETKPINRLALICEHCRLVNGQAPPGVKDLSEIGRWKCVGCREWNGEVSEVKKLLQEAGSAAKSGDRGIDKKVEESEAEESFEESMVTEEDASPPARSTRSKTAKADADT